MKWIVYLLASFVLGINSANAESKQALYGDWELSCNTDSCVIGQGLSTKKGDLLYGVRIAKTNTSSTVTVQLNLPLGLYLPPGVGVKVSDHTRSFPMTTCLPKGCIANFPMDDQLAEKLKTDDNLIARFYLSDGEQPREVSFSLNGFSEAYEALLSN